MNLTRHRAGRRVLKLTPIDGTRGAGNPAPPSPSAPHQRKNKPAERCREPITNAPRPASAARRGDTGPVRRRWESQLILITLLNDSIGFTRKKTISSPFCPASCPPPPPPPAASPHKAPGGWGWGWGAGAPLIQKGKDPIAGLGEGAGRGGAGRFGARVGWDRGLGRRDPPGRRSPQASPHPGPLVTMSVFFPSSFPKFNFLII